MKTLLVLAVYVYRFHCIFSIYGYWQPSHAHVLLNKFSYGDMIFKKCEKLNGDIVTTTFLDQDFLLCFGVKVFSQQIHNRTEASSVLEGDETKSDLEFCKHYEEMKLDWENNKTVDVYNRQFRDRNTCERACLDVMANVNPLCRFILLLSRHSKGNHNGTQAPLTTLPVGKADNVANEVSNLKTDSKSPRKMIEESSNSIPNNQKLKASDGEVVINEQNPKISVQEQTFDKLKSGLKRGEDKSNAQKTEIIPVDQTSQGLKSALLGEEAKLQGQKEQTGGTEIAHDERKQKDASGEPQVAESLKSTKLEVATSGIEEQKNEITSDTITANNMLKKTANSKKEPPENTAENTNLSVKNENQDKSDSVMGKNASVHSSVEIATSHGGNKNEAVVAIRPKAQETVSVGENNIASKKVVDTDVQGEESVSQVTNIEAVINSPKLQADNKETENPPLKETHLQVSSKPTIQGIPKSNTEEQKTNQNNENVYANENAETIPHSGTDGAPKTVSEEMQLNDDSGDGVGELDPQFSVETGESNDNTEVPSGGGTVVDYARPGPDVHEIGNNEMDAGTLVIREKYEDDDSHFFAYFMTTMIFCIVGYLVFHNKQKILALALEGRARRGRRRPNTSGYRKLDSNLEEAISSSKSASVTQVIY